MKNAIQFLAISIFFLTVQSSFGQTTSSTKKIYKVWVKPKAKASIIQGYLIDVGDTLVISPKYADANQPLKRISLDDVEYVDVQRKGKMGRSMLVGALTGIVAGALIGADSYKEKECPPGQFCFGQGKGLQVLGGSILGGGMGLLIGGIAGSMKVQIPIQGNSINGNAQKEELRKYQLW